MDNLAKLKDIKSIVEVSDYSLFLFIGVILLCLVVVLTLIYLGYNFYKNHKKIKYNFNLKNSKQTAYKLIEIIRDKEGSDEYIQKLHNYTYKKNVPQLDEKLFNEITKRYKISY